MSAQLEDGFARIANSILEELAKASFNGTQFNILLAVIRATYGYQKKSHRISISFLSDATGRSRNLIKREIDKLIEMQVIKVFAEGSFTESRDIGINTDLGVWQLEGCTPIRVQSSNKSTVLQTDEKVYSDQSTGGVLRLESQKRKKIYKDIKDNKNIVDSDESITSKKFIKPDLEQVQAYCAERNKGVDAERWFDFYTAKGWKIGKETMKDWKAAVRTWERKESAIANKQVAATSEKKPDIYDKVYIPTAEELADAPPRG